MSYNLLQSHRTYNIKCKWWSRINNSFEYEKSPNGIFFAKEVTEKTSERSNFVNNPMVLVGRDNIIIESPDNLMGIKTDDSIEFQGEKWFVVSIRRIQSIAQQNIMTRTDKLNFKWRLELRK